ncbi:MAG TPA: hypothetical protein VNN08_11810 [Thermoanaerobaculia bacterium]|nr:hypothetical protein [Thermoanaerobaculia bacterium]
MRTGQQQETKKNDLSFESIDDQINDLLDELEADGLGAEGAEGFFDRLLGPEAHEKN